MKSIGVPKISSSIGTQYSEASEDIIRPQFSEQSDEDTEEVTDSTQIQPITRLALHGQHGFQSLMISAVGNRIIPLLTSQSEETAKQSAIPVGVAHLGMITLVIGMCSRMLQPKQQYDSVALHITTAGTVLKSYVLLLLINTRYISLAVIPVMMVVFIGALCRKFLVETCRRQLQHDYSHGASSKASSVVFCKSEEQLTLIVEVLPFWLQLSGVTLAQQDRVLVSHFLVFISSAMVALATLITRTVPVGIYPGVSRVVPLMHKTCIVLILVSVHTMAGEWFGAKSMALACTPELVALLISVIWFSLPIDREHRMRFVANGAHVSNVTCLIVVVAMWACVVVLTPNDETTFPQASWDTSFWGIAGLSGGLCCFSSWILRKWPRAKSFPLPEKDGAPLLLQLLQISAVICLFTSVSTATLQQLARFVPTRNLIAVTATGALLIVPVLVNTRFLQVLTGVER